MRFSRAPKRLQIAPILILALALSVTSVPAPGAGQSTEDLLKRLDGQFTSEPSLPCLPVQTLHLIGENNAEGNRFRRTS